MKNDIDVLKKKIDVLRGSMHVIAEKKKYCFCDSEVIAASVRLDQVLTTYQRLLARKAVKGARRYGARA